MSQIFIDIIVFLGLLLGGLFALVRYLESVSVFFPSRNLVVNPALVGLPFEDVYFNAKDKVKINGWFFKHPHAKSTVLMAHGNAGNMSDRLFKVKFLYDLGLNVFIFDYRGYGRSEGRPSEPGIYMDARAAYDYLQSRGDVLMDHIIFYGVSLGGVVAVDLAANRPGALLIVESSFTSAAEMARLHYHFVPTVFLSLKFNSLDKVKNLALPKIFMHSHDDEVVPYWIGEKLFTAAAGPKEFVRIHGSHNEASLTSDPTAAAELIRVLKEKDLL